MHKSVFTIDEEPIAYIGYTEGRRCVPYFEVDEAFALMKDFNKDAKALMYYEEATDSFRIDGTDHTDCEVWKGKNYQTDEGIKHLYGIGADSWRWENEEGFQYFLAELIADLLQSFGPLQCIYLWYTTEELIKRIFEKLKDLNVYKEAITIWNSRDLTEALKVLKLRQIIKC